jgi:hypothetical protein
VSCTSWHIWDNSEEILKNETGFGINVCLMSTIYPFVQPQSKNLPGDLMKVLQLAIAAGSCGGRSDPS